ncbi:MAG: hypothetical protein AB9M53_06940 [Leptothrix sp. (in: b-proteobacteria)]
MAEPASTCPTCHGECGEGSRSIAYQVQQVTHLELGDTSDEVAQLTMHEGKTLAVFCCKACCRQVLPGILESVGIPANTPAITHAGPLCACARCGKPVLMTEPHQALAEHQHEDDIPQVGDRNTEAALFKVLAVLCADCGWLMRGAADEAAGDPRAVEIDTPYPMERA